MVLVDWTHMSRRASGIERITAELFSAEALAPLSVGVVRGPTGGKLGMLLGQQLNLPVRALWDRSSVVLFPGYPPSLTFGLHRDRSVMYVHDLFLATRSSDLNLAGRYYLAPQFKTALRRLRYFLTNSHTTAHELASWVGADAEIRTYRPKVRNVFGLSSARPPSPEIEAGRPLIVGTIGTIEPRKNLVAALRVCEALAVRLERPVELHVLGRAGWGPDAEVLAAHPAIRLLGYLPDDAARQAIEQFDLYLTTSHDEGLGLPLLEVQFGGLAVVAPDKPVFREVLAASGTFIDPEKPARTAEAIAELISRPEWQQSARALATANIARWNAAAADDRRDVVAFLEKLERAAAIRAVGRLNLSPK